MQTHDSAAVQAISTNQAASTSHAISASRSEPRSGAGGCADTADGAQSRCTVLDLTVSNHPGVMSHVCGLFSRRAFNVEAILCMPLNLGLSRILLLVRKDGRLAQMTAQAEKLRDVHEVRQCPELHSLFGQLQANLNWTDRTR